MPPIHALDGDACTTTTTTTITTDDDASTLRTVRQSDATQEEEEGGTNKTHKIQRHNQTLKLPPYKPVQIEPSQTTTEPNMD